MSLKSSTLKETNTYEVEVSVDKETFEKAINAVYKKQVKKINVPGFRVGKAPRHIIEKMYGSDVFYDDAMQQCYPEALENAAKEANLKIVTVTDLSVEDVTDGFTFKATLIVEPDIVIEGYKGIEVTKKSTEVTDELVEKEIESVRERNSRMVTVDDRPVKDGDIAVIDFDGFVDGVAFDGGKGEDFELTIGSGQFIPGFEDQIIGHNTGDEFDVNVKFPKEYTPELADKDAVFKVKVKEIKAKELPELDDEFAKDVSEDADTLAALKKSIKAELGEGKKAQADKDFESALLEQLADGVKGEIPEVMYDNKVEDDINNFSQRLASQGMDIDTYLKYTGMDMNKLKENFRDGAVKQVKLMLAIEKIAKLENIEASDEEVENKYKEMADLYKFVWKVAYKPNSICHQYFFAFS